MSTAPAYLDDEVSTLIAKPSTRRARIKGSWTMYWGLETFEFEDGKTYDIANDLYEYLKYHGNIYDVLV